MPPSAAADSASQNTRPLPRNTVNMLMARGCKICNTSPPLQRYTIAHKVPYLPACAKEVFCFALGVGAGRRAFPKGGSFCSVSSKISVFSMSLSLHSHSLRKYACFFWRNLSLSYCFFRQKKPSLFPKNDFLFIFPGMGGLSSTTISIFPGLSPHFPHSRPPIAIRTGRRGPPESP